MEFKELLDWAKSEALANTVQATEVSVWRQICRSYSKKFSTPLHLCLDGTIDPADILLAEFEDQLEDFDHEKDLEVILEQIYRIEDPNYDQSRNDELHEFIRKSEREEEDRVKAGKPIHKALANQKNTPEKPKDETPKKTGGFVNLSYLEKEETSSPGGFGED